MEEHKEKAIKRKKFNRKSSRSPKTSVDISRDIKTKDTSLAKVPLYKIYLFGERGSGFRVKGDVQDFYKIRDKCLLNNVLWEDPEFPANDKSLFYSKTTQYEWKRPKEIVDDPHFVDDGFSRFDLKPGELIDCWLLAAVANLKLYRRLFYQIVPDDQNFTDKYAGVFHFRFWQYGRWIDVVIDDRLPTYGGKLIYMRSTESNEFWSPLLEKAYAKLHGIYEDLSHGSTCEAMEDFTGGVNEIYEMKSCPPNLFEMLLKAYERSSLMTGTIDPVSSVPEAKTPKGLYKGHAYSITCVKYADMDTPYNKGKIALLRLCSPWDAAQSRGPHSDEVPKWCFIPHWEKMNLTCSNGEFWISFEDFMTHFNRLEICNLCPDFSSGDEVLEGNKKKWEMSVFEGEWVSGVTAGGCRNCLDTFANNPQYCITLEDPDEEDNDKKCTVIIALMQKKRNKQSNLTIGFTVYHLKNPDGVPKPLDKNFFRSTYATVESYYLNIREITCRYKMSPGTYCIVPTTFDPNEQSEFLLRVFSEHKNNMEEHDVPVGLKDVLDNVKDKKPTREEQVDMENTRKLFLKISGEDMAVDWMELKEILDHRMRRELKEKFSNDTCRSLVAMMDVNYSGKLDFEEFKLLWTDIRKWRNVFIFYDKSYSNQLSAFELREALNSAGYKVNNHILNILVHRYGTKGGFITFDDFIMCAVRLKIMFDFFRDKDPDNTDSATFSLEEWVQKTVYS